MSRQPEKPTEQLVNRVPKMPPVHPGEVLRGDVLSALEITVSEAARQLGVSRQSLYRIMAGSQPVTVEMALRLGKFCGNGAALWLRMQQAHDLWVAEQRMREEIAKIPAHG